MRVAFSSLLPLGALAGLLFAGCNQAHEAAAPGESPSAARGVVTLSADAQQTAGIQTVAVTRRAAAKTLRLTGWFATVPQSEVIVKSPVSGFVIPPASAAEGDPVTLGSRVEKAARMAMLEAFLSPQEQAQLVIAKEEADTTMAQSLVTMQMAEAQLKRYENAKEAIPGVRVNDLRETYERAKAAYHEAEEKLPFLPKDPVQFPVGLESVPIAAPIAGRITTLHVSPRQFVVQGDPLWTISDWSRLWVRVPVFEDDLGRIVTSEPAEITAAEMHTAIVGHHVSAPQPVEPGRRTVDVYYEIENPGERFRPGQSAQVRLPLEQSAERLVVPTSAVLWDGLGGAWVYVRVGDEQFRRQRVELGAYVAEVVVVERGLGDGDAVVATGAESLYGQEFKSDIQGDSG
jgi:RND family efflux transporter MFP subunit